MSVSAEGSRSEAPARASESTGRKKNEELGCFQPSGTILLESVGDLRGIQSRLFRAWANNPAASRILGVGWRLSAVGHALPTAQILDSVVQSTPIYLLSSDRKLLWVNSEALREMGIAIDTPDVRNGLIIRGRDGDATGLLYGRAIVEYASALLITSLD